MNQPKILLIVFSTPLRVIPLDEELITPFVVEGEVFEDSGLGDWVGFYDWLRTASGDLIGVRSWVQDRDVAEVRRQLARHASVEERGGIAILVFLSNARDFHEASSDDQALGTHRILVSGRGTLALAFSIDDLPASEIASLAEFWRR